MTPDVLKQLYSEGAAAGKAGASNLSNPLYRTENLPDMTDEEFKAWELQARAWESGWRVGSTPEHTIRVGERRASTK